VSASSDAVSGRGRRPLGRSSSSPVLLTLAVLCLVYQQVPPPFGAIIVKSWLHYALPILGGLLLANFGRNVAKTTWSQLRRVARQAKKIVQGFDFSVRFDPNCTAGVHRGSDHLLDEERSDIDRTAPAATSALRRHEDDDG
jgi:hypothetical protein